MVTNCYYVGNKLATKCEHVGIKLAKTFSTYLKKIESNLETNWKRVGDGNNGQHVSNKFKILSIY